MVVTDGAYRWFRGVVGFVGIFAGLNVGTWIHGSMSGAWAGPVSAVSCGAVVLAVVLVGHLVTGQIGRFHLYRAR